MNEPAPASVAIDERIGEPRAPVSTFWCAALLAYAGVMPAIGAAVLTPLAVANSGWLSANAPGLLLPICFTISLLCGFAMLPTFVATVLLVWLYGPLVGLAASVVTYAISASLGFSLSRLVGRAGMQQLIDSRPKLRAVRDALVRTTFVKSARTILLLRISPLIPFALNNVVAGTAGARWDAFLAGTVAGLLPRGLLVAGWAAKLQYLTFEQPKDYGILLIGIGVTVGVLIILSHWARRAIRHAAGKEDRFD